jgi:hypothetical protein
MIRHRLIRAQPTQSTQLNQPTQLDQPNPSSLADPTDPSSAQIRLNSTRDDAIILPDSPFPLLQQTEHPITGEIVWSVHPCQVGPAVDEIINDDASTLGMPALGNTGVEGEMEGALRRGVRWLEVWMMLSNSVVDLRI